MPKKKKTQLKPVARGFATTSVPKKVLPEPILDISPATSSSNQCALEDQPAETVKGQGTTTSSSVSHDDFDPDMVDEQSIQNLIDKFQEKTEKEIVRYYPKNLCCPRAGSNGVFQRLNRTIKVPRSCEDPVILANGSF